MIDSSVTKKPSKLFLHNSLPKIELVRLDSPNGRVYLTEDGKRYPSMTSVLGFESKPELEEWKARVGKEEAERVSARARGRGTLIHAYAEDYLNNKSVDVSMFDVDLWKKFRPVLDRIDNIRLLEGKLYSDKLEVSGTVDCVADFDGVTSGIDFKTAGRLKTEDEILSYFIQVTGYCCMVYERYGLKIRQIVVLIAVDNEDPQIFVRDIGQYLDPLFDIIKRYKAHVASLRSI